MVSKRLKLLTKGKIGNLNQEVQKNKTSWRKILIKIWKNRKFKPKTKFSKEKSCKSKNVQEIAKNTNHKHRA